MALETEAACLLRSGLAYPKRAGLLDDDGNLVFSGFKPGGFSLYLGDEPCYHFDLEGRWQRAVVGGTHYLKDLGGLVESVGRERLETGLTLRRRRLSFADSSDLDDSVRAVALDLTERLQDGRLRLQAPPSPDAGLDRASLVEMLGRIALWDHAAWFRQREQYLVTYGPSGFLPPSCSSPVVLEASVRSTYETGFHPGETALRTPSEFAEHVSAVSEMLGLRAVQARGLVIQHGDFWDQPAEAVLPYLETASRVFPLSTTEKRPRLSSRPIDQPMLDGFYAFLPSPLARGPGRAGWRRLAESGLKRVDLGFSSDSEDSSKAQVHDLQAAGIGVGLVIPVGADPSLSIEDEAASILSFLNGLGLKSDDHVYLIDASEVSTAPDASERRDAIRVHLQAHRPKGGFRVVPYTLAKQ